MSSLILKSYTELALCRLAEKLICLVEKGDTIFLKGTLGAGKTTFARALIRAATGNESQDVQSPTFPLLIPYETDRFPIHHYDLYRLGDVSELEELGLFDERDDRLTLIEWPERLEEADFPSRIEIELSESKTENARNIKIKGVGESAQKVERFKALLEFVDKTDWCEASWRFLEGDASSRSYIRLVKNDKTCLLMNAPPQSDGPPIRDGKAYSKIAHLAEGMTSFVAVADALGKSGLSVPTVSHHDAEQGFLIIRDLGNAPFYHLIKNLSESHEELGALAIDVLVHLRENKPTNLAVEGKPYHIPHYDNQALSIEAELAIDWYWPAVKGNEIEADNRLAFTNLWLPLFEKVQQNANHWVLRDFHSPNLMALEGDNALAKVGVIDFQDACIGHAAYDVVSLCQDARITVSRPLENALKQRYVNSVLQNEPDFDQEEFLLAYAILGAQRASKIIGIFVRLAKRDGKTGYLTHLPRCWDYLERNLEHRALSDIKSWYDNQFPALLRGRAWENKEK